MVVPQHEYSPYNNVMMLAPDILMESDTHKEYDYLTKLKQNFTGRIIMTPYCPDISSTEIKRKACLT